MGRLSGFSILQALRDSSVVTVPRTLGANVPWGLIGKIRVDLAQQCCVEEEGEEKEGEGQGGRGLEDRTEGEALTDPGLGGASLTADPQFPAGSPRLGALSLE